MLNELLLFDIIEQNINTRPILFASVDEKFKNYLQFDGILYQLLPINENDSISQEISISNMEKNLNNNIQTLSYNLKDILNFDEDRYIMNYFNLIISFYLEKGDKQSALKRAKEAAEQKTVTLYESTKPVESNLLNEDNIKGIEK